MTLLLVLPALYVVAGVVTVWLMAIVARLLGHTPDVISLRTLLVVLAWPKWAKMTALIVANRLRQSARPQTYLAQPHPHYAVQEPAPTWPAPQAATDLTAGW